MNDLQPSISLKGVSKWYGQILGVSQIHLEIFPGITGLLGPNGCGKSTLLQLLAGEMKPSQGEIQVLGKPVWNNLALRSEIAFCPDGDGFYEECTGREFLEILGRLSRLSLSQARSKAGELVEIFDLAQVADRPISTYSRGMRQKLKFAQTFTGDPKVLLLDEPLNSTDPVARALLLEHIKKAASQGATILLSSHILHEIENITDTVAVMVSGKLIAKGKVEEIRALLPKVPHRISLTLDQPRKLAGILSEFPSVQGIQFLSDRQMEITTENVEEVLQKIPPLILKNNLQMYEMETMNENLEELFSLLTQRRILMGRDPV